MAFDVEGARKAGYSDAEIADHLAKERSFDLAGAKKAGYTDPEVISHLATGGELAPPKPTVLQRMKDAVTGELRRTKETEALPDWADMPELNTASMASAKTGLGTLLSNPQETVQVIQANFPGVQTRQDEKGNFLLRSSIDGKEYAIKPGFRVSDIPRAAGALGTFALGGEVAALPQLGRVAAASRTIPGVAAVSAGTQAAIEGTQAATGGEFNPGEVVTAGVMGGAVPAVIQGVKAAAQPVRQLLGRGGAAPQPAGAGVPPVAAAAPETVPGVPLQGAPVAPAAPAAAVTPPAAPAMSAAELAQTARSAAEGGLGSGRATRVLAEQAAPDAQTVEAAKRLGIDEFLQPDHVTTSQAYRELAQAVKSVPGSQSRSAELVGLEQVAKRADDLINEVGGTTDVSALDASVKQRLRATHGKLEGQANDLYRKVEEQIPKGRTVEAPDTLGFLGTHARELGGAERLSPVERKLFETLSATEDGTSPVTYAFLDRTRKEIGQAMQKASGPFKDSESGLLKKLYGTLTADQERVAGELGALHTFQAAKYATRLMKGIEDDLVALFGKQVDGSLVGDLSGAVNALPKGDASKLVKLLQSVPEEMRQNVVASGLNAAFGKTARNGTLNFNSYAKWYEGLERNQQARNAVMTHLPPEAQRQLADLYRVSRGVSSATRERITTGRIQAVQQELQGADSLMANIYGLAKRAAVGIPAEAATSAVGLPGAGIASGIASALTKGKPNALKAADALISSPEFIQATKQAGQQQEAAVRALAESKPFQRFVRALGAPQELNNAQRWVLNALQANNAMGGQGSAPAQQTPTKF